MARAGELREGRGFLQASRGSLAPNVIVPRLVKVAEESELFEAQDEDRERGVADLFRDIHREARLPLHVTPLDALSAVMCTFSQHVCVSGSVVSGVDSRRVWEGFPKSLAPYVGRCMLHRLDEPSRFDRPELVCRVADHLCVSLEDAEHITSAVLVAASSRLRWSLPPELRALWGGGGPVRSVP